MNSKVQSLKAFLGSAARLALVEVTGTKGSTPREKGAFMLVSHAATSGTIGGGQLEYMAIDKARQTLGSSPSKRGGARIEVNEVCATLDVPLGPEIGQCCGGRVEVSIRVVDAALAAELIAAAEAEEADMPHVYVFGGGHVGQALAASLALLPVHAVVIETRAEALDSMPMSVETRLTPMPEAEVRNAPPGTAFAILTHDHALDFLIVSEALKRDDAAYVGMIGSKTKKATFRNWFLKSADGEERQFARLVSPIGGDAVKDKRPPVIAALAAAEIMTALAAHNAASNDGHQARPDKVIAG
ncbi:MAG: xanthine dehydrogenase accessory protein XdhC [Mesorhizobium sp.]|nr:xanthine dehydrogenase accessory protein XdhC [bacterium M00.F.Ca.ET.205.01.1.1]TGU49171.1 xanthine dehydrogenase accessory protein XdhC [bacterium M00.F.Ca.ET.152.01.1.1]TGV32912.1 xanthine dehydrogenase accessory protein XdhC [Mesorhizobium sp. M00.F.Ca.ET.186.01.1.1]TGZ40149.1 xanthine dehydrogenase accessory protein XdhC [bacterium M00.F.Ca.ET.162.01.1.1]TJW33300.1 MAG: xanthine dehydrogenase accessory protein XdhC [Mesorhizobium sp.]